MKPKPFASLNHFTIPVAIERSLGRLEPPITIIRTSGRSGECLCAPKVARPTVDGGHFLEFFRQRRTSPAQLMAQGTLRQLHLDAGPVEAHSHRAAGPLEAGRRLGPIEAALEMKLCRARRD